MPYNAHTSTLSHQDREIPQKGRFLALDVGTDGPHSLSRHQTRTQLNLGKGEGSCGAINTQQTYIYAKQEISAIDIFYKLKDEQ